MDHIITAILVQKGHKWINLSIITTKFNKIFFKVRSWWQTNIKCNHCPLIHGLIHGFIISEYYCLLWEEEGHEDNEQEEDDKKHSVEDFSKLSPFCHSCQPRVCLQHSSLVIPALARLRWGERNIWKYSKENMFKDTSYVWGNGQNPLVHFDQMCQSVSFRNQTYRSFYLYFIINTLKLRELS